MAAKAVQDSMTIIFPSSTRSSLAHGLDRLSPTYRVASPLTGLLSNRELKKIVADMVD